MTPSPNFFGVSWDPWCPSNGATGTFSGVTVKLAILICWECCRVLQHAEDSSFALRYDSTHEAFDGGFLKASVKSPTKTKNGWSGSCHPAAVLRSGSQEHPDPNTAAVSSVPVHCPTGNTLGAIILMDRWWASSGSFETHPPMKAFKLDVFLVFRSNPFFEPSFPVPDYVCMTYVLQYTLVSWIIWEAKVLPGRQEMLPFPDKFVPGCTAFFQKRQKEVLFQKKYTLEALITAYNCSIVPGKQKNMPGSAY